MSNIRFRSVEHQDFFLADFYTAFVLLLFAHRGFI